MANERDTTLVPVNLDRKRPNRANDAERSAVWVGPGKVEVPKWVADEWAKPRAQVEPVDQPDLVDRTDLEGQIAALTRQIAALKSGGPLRVMNPTDDPNVFDVNLDAIPLDAASVTLEDGSVITRDGIQTQDKEGDDAPPVTVETVKEGEMKTTETVEVVDGSRAKGKTK
jgi:hypothetical protein